MTCYTNVALLYLKTRRYDQTIIACNEALKINAENVKALYLRSRARSRLVRPGGPGGGVGVEEDMAQYDLELASRLDPTNRVIA